MASEQLQSICLANATASFLEGQLAAQCLPFLKKKNYVPLTPKFQEEVDAPSWNHVTYFIVLNFDRGVEKQK